MKIDMDRREARRAETERVAPCCCSTSCTQVFPGGVWGGRRTIATDRKAVMEKEKKAGRNQESDDVKGGRNGESNKGRGRLCGM